MKKNLNFKYLLVLMAAVMVVGGCNKPKTQKEVTYQVTEEELSYALPKIGEAIIMDTKVQAGVKGTITVATVGSPNTEILQEAARLMEQKGYFLKIEVCEDYFTPNQLVQEGKVDCNFYQHEAFLERYNIENGTNLTEMAQIYYEPLAIYSEKVDALSDVSQGAVVAVPENPTALAQALFLLQEKGMLTLMNDADLTAVIDDISENPKELEIVPMPEAEILEKLGEVDLAICHTGYKLNLAMDNEDILLTTEGKETMAARKLSQAIVVSEYPNDNADILTEIMMSTQMQEFIEKTYQGSLYVMDGKLSDVKVTMEEKAEESAADESAEE